MTKPMGYGLAVLLTCALMLAGCGGGGGGEPTVTQTIHDELQAELDAALAELATEREAKAAEATARTAAETEVARLGGVLGSEDDDADADGSLYAQLNAATAEVEQLEAQLETTRGSVEQLTTQLQSATANVDSLTARIGSVDDPDSLNGMLAAEQAEVRRLTGALDTANDKVTDLTGRIGTAADADSLEGMLAAQKAEVARLEGLIGGAGDMADAAATASLHAQLNAAKAEVTRLEGVIGSATDPAKADGSLHAQINAEKAKVTDLTTRLTTANDRVTELEGEIGSTGDATSLKGQLDAANTKVNRLTAELEAANTSLNSLRGQLTTAQQQAEQERQRATTAQQQATQQAQQQIDEARQGELNARAGVYLSAINAGTARTGHSVEWDRGGTRTINPGGNFVSGSGAPAISGFTAHTYTRRVSSSQQTAYIYTNIQAPGSRPFWQLHGVNDITGAHDNSAFDPTPTAAARVVRAGNARIDYETLSTYDISVTGTYDGVRGTYTCSACEIVDRTDDSDTDITAADFNAADWVMVADGERLFVAGNTWDFEPGSIASGVQQMSDNEHLYFGIWVLEPNVGSEMHDYEYIVGGEKSILTDNVPTTVAAGTSLANFNLLTGTAEFTGGAIGKFVTRNQVGENARIGTFNATATFTADFGSATDPGTLEGRITNFRSPGQTLEGDWYLYLGEIDTGADPTTEAPIAFAEGTVGAGAEVGGEIGGVSVVGTWNATLYGSDNQTLGHTAASPRDLSEYPLTRYPLVNLAGIAGNFHASSTDAALAGAFGATPR